MNISTTKFKAGDYAWYLGTTKQIKILIKVVRPGLGSELKMRLTRKQMERYYRNVPRRSDWAILSRLIPLSELEQMVLLSDPNFTSDYEFFDESV